MSNATRNSNCSSGLIVDYYWWSCADHARSAHIDAAANAVWGALQRRDRRWNPYTRAMARREIRHRLARASEGRLVPVDEIKPLRDGRASLFEIRWNGITATRQLTADSIKHEQIEARLIQAEPLWMGVAAVGLHTHEKVIYPGNAKATKEAQNVEIDVAEMVYYAGVANSWGLFEE